MRRVKNLEQKNDTVLALFKFLWNFHDIIVLPKRVKIEGSLTYVSRRSALSLKLARLATVVY